MKRCRASSASAGRARSGSMSLRCTLHEQLLEVLRLRSVARSVSSAESTARLRHSSRERYDVETKQRLCVRSYLGAKVRRRERTLDHRSSDEGRRKHAARPMSRHGSARAELTQMFCCINNIHEVRCHEQGSAHSRKFPEYKMQRGFTISSVSFDVHRSTEPLRSSHGRNRKKLFRQGQTLHAAR